MVFPLLFHINFGAVTEYQRAMANGTLEVVRAEFDSVEGHFGSPAMDGEAVLQRGAERGNSKAEVRDESIAWVRRPEMRQGTAGRRSLEWQVVIPAELEVRSSSAGKQGPGPWTQACPDGQGCASPPSLHCFVEERLVVAELRGACRTALILGKGPSWHGGEHLAGPV